MLAAKIIYLIGVLLLTIAAVADYNLLIKDAAAQAKVRPSRMALMTLVCDIVIAIIIALWPLCFVAQVTRRVVMQFRKA